MAVTDMAPIAGHPSTTELSESLGLDRDAVGRMKLPRRLGNVISGLDEAQMAPVAEAAHMRPDDYVIGLVVRGAPRAYPVWVVDNYHVVNERVGSLRYVVMSCERCQSGAAFLAEPPGDVERTPLFRSTAFQNASLLVKDLRSGSSWIHWEGYGLNRRGRGMRLAWIPTYHMEWADWAELHPDTVVMVPPDDPTHPDARHGHGREEWFGRPGMDPAFLGTIVGPPDESYPENEMVLAIEHDAGWSAYPLREVQREDGVVQGATGERPIVVFAGPRSDGFTMAAFESRHDGRGLSFVRERDRFRDRETDSSWTIEGVATDGPLRGEHLQPIRSYYVRWHAIAYSHRGSVLFRSSRPVPPPDQEGVDLAGFDRVLERLVAADCLVGVEGPVVSQRRPRGSEASLTVRIDGHRLHLHRFRSARSAADYEAFEAAVSGSPIRARSYEARTLRAGRLVVESDPDRRFLDPFQIVPIPYRAMGWAPILDAPVLRSAMEDAMAIEEVAEDDGSPAFTDFVRRIERAGFEVVDIGYLPLGQLRPGCVDGIGLTIEAERFLLYLFSSPARAEAFATQEDHCVPAGPFVLRSTPNDMYEHQAYEILHLADDRIGWSRLLDDERLLRALAGVARPSAVGVRIGEGAASG